jgi:hypothetical protein
MLSLDALVICALLAMPAAPSQDPPAPPEPPAQPEPAPDPEPEPKPEPQPEPAPEPEPEPSADEPAPDSTHQQSEREQQLEEELAEARARATELERMIDELRQQVAKLRAELAARPAPTPPVAKAPPPSTTPSPAAPESEPIDKDSSAPQRSKPARSWDEDPSDRRSAPNQTPTPSQEPLAGGASSDAEAVLASMRAAYASRFPATPSPSQRDTFDAFTADVVKWSASQQRSLRAPVTWTVQLVRVEKGSARDRMVRFIARDARRADSRGAGTAFIVRLPRTDADELLKGDYRGATYEVTGTLSPIVRFAPERPYDGISAAQTAFVGPYCEAALVIDCQSIRPGT